MGLTNREEIRVDIYIYIYHTSRCYQALYTYTYIYICIYKIVYYRYYSLSREDACLFFCFSEIVEVVVAHCFLSYFVCAFSPLAIVRFERSRGAGGVREGKQRHLAGFLNNRAS